MCNQEIHSDTHDNLKQAAISNEKETQDYLNTLLDKYEDISKELESIGPLDNQPNTFYNTVDQAYNHRSNLESLELQLANKQAESDTYQEQIDELSLNALQEINWDNINVLTAVKEHQEFLLKLLTNKDSFIRKKIIDQNLTYLNSRLTHYLDKIGLPHLVKFQNDLSVEITYLGQDLDFDNLSRGERNRLILSLS